MQYWPRLISISIPSGLVNYVKSNIEREGEKLILHIEDESSIQLMGTLKLMVDGSIGNCGSNCSSIRLWPFYDMESFNIALQSKFVDLKTITDLDDRAILLQVVGNVTEDNVKRLATMVLAKQLQTRAC